MVSSVRDTIPTALRLAMVAGLLFATASCSSSVEPRAGVTLLVTNETCAAGHCDSLEVLGFPANQPNAPGGMWSIDLGLITTAQTCISLPPSQSFRIIGQHENGTPDTTTIRWTNAHLFSIGAIAPSGSRIEASPRTAGFLPADAAGWAISVPNGTRVTPSAACAP